MTFQLDTSGRVRAAPNAPHAANWYCWADLTPFAQGYVGAMFASAGADIAIPLGGFSSGSRAARFSDLAPATVERIIADCAREDRYYPNTPEMGRRFWEERQARKHLTTFRPLVPFLSDDGLIMLREVGE